MPSVQHDQLYICAFADPSGGKARGAGHSRSALAVCAMDGYERVFILRCWASHMATNSLVDEIFKLNEKWQPVVFGIDASGPQGPFVDMLRRERERREAEAGRVMHFPLRAVTLHDDKQFSIETTLQPLAAAGRLFRPLEMYVPELMGEWKNFPGGQYRDSLDALACCIRLLPRKAPDVLAAQSREAHRVYLRRIGMSEREIDRALAARDSGR